jgi:hypothetical protein
MFRGQLRPEPNPSILEAVLEEMQGEPWLDLEAVSGDCTTVSCRHCYYVHVQAVENCVCGRVHHCFLPALLMHACACADALKDTKVDKNHSDD